MTDFEFALVAVEAPLGKALTYKIPEQLAAEIRVGSRVMVPLGRRAIKGVVTAGANQSKDKPSKFKIKAINELTGDPVLDSKNMQWLSWLSQYYLHPPGLVYSLAFAPLITDRKRKAKNPPPTDLAEDAIERLPAPIANPEQKKAIDAIVDASKTGKFETFLLFGVTGSGKTEVYLQSIKEVLESGKQVLVLVPEISLTPQLIRRFIGRFGENVAVIHSHLTEREKSDQWKAALSGGKKILVGARSAVFCPLDTLGLVIVDEEHEPSYKQEEQLKYNARDAAIMKASIFKCPIVLGSATPSLESWYNTESGKYKMLKLPSRVENRNLPEVKVVDLRESKKEKRDSYIPSWISTPLFEEIGNRLKNKEQSALFINRRGYAQFALCSGCGYVEQCQRCSVTLTLHNRGLQLICHYCGFQKPKPLMCPSCRGFPLKSIGLGTEKVKEELQIFFPEARIARADRDEIDSRKSLEELLDKIMKHEIDIIVGTQMIAKGHDFPLLTLVGTLAADLGLHFPDFRSSERTFQLLTQVAGRAGRHQKPGLVIVQTYLPDHPAIHYSVTHDYVGFAKVELTERKELGYPPFGKLAMIRFQGPDQNKTEDVATAAKDQIELLKKQHPEFESIEALGPAEAALVKIKNKFRYQILIKTKSSKNLNLFLQRFINHAEVWAPSQISVTVDVDPLHLL